MSTTYLNRLIARAGVCSRRQAGKLIIDSRVRVDGKILTENKLIAKDAQIMIDGEKLQIWSPKLWMYHKPRGEIVSQHDEMNRTTIFDSIRKKYKIADPLKVSLGVEGSEDASSNNTSSSSKKKPAKGKQKNKGQHKGMRGHPSTTVAATASTSSSLSRSLELPPHLMAVGRLDYHSQGLILLTNDGDIARYLETSDTPRHYKVRATGVENVNRERKRRIKEELNKKGGGQIGQQESKGEGDGTDEGSSSDIDLGIDFDEDIDQSLKRLSESSGYMANGVNYGPMQVERMMSKKKRTEKRTYMEECLSSDELFVNPNSNQNQLSAQDDLEYFDAGAKEEEAKIQRKKRLKAFEKRSFHLDKGMSYRQRKKMDVSSMDGDWFNVTLREGKNREIRKVFASLGLNVNRIIRQQYGSYQLGPLNEGCLRELTVHSSIEDHLAGMEKGKEKEKEKKEGEEKGKGKGSGKEKETRQGKAKGKEKETDQKKVRRAETGGDKEHTKMGKQEKTKTAKRNTGESNEDRKQTKGKEKKRERGRGKKKVKHMEETDGENNSQRRRKQSNPSTKKGEEGVDSPDNESSRL